jgi:hypothetical protein
MARNSLSKMPPPYTYLYRFAETTHFQTLHQLNKQNNDLKRQPVQVQTVHKMFRNHSQGGKESQKSEIKKF